MHPKSTVHHNKGLSLFFGIFLILLGLFTINARFFISSVTIYLFGWVLLIGGGAQCFASFYAGSWGKFFITLVSGLISFIIGGAIVVNPNLSSQTFALLVSIVLLVDGLFKIAGSAASHTENKTWGIISGILIFLLGVALWLASPIGNMGLIGFIIGLGILISGFVIITHAYTNHTVTYKRLA